MFQRELHEVMHAAHCRSVTPRPSHLFVIYSPALQLLEHGVQSEVCPDVHEPEIYWPTRQVWHGWHVIESVLVFPKQMPCLYVPVGHEEMHCAWQSKSDMSSVLVHTIGAEV